MKRPSPTWIFHNSTKQDCQTTTRWNGWTKVIGAFPDGQSALVLVYARLRHVTASGWGHQRYMNMDHFREIDLQKTTNEQANRPL